MASNPRRSRSVPVTFELEDEEEEEDEEYEEDEDEDPEAEALNLAIEASLQEAEAAADRDSPEVEVLEVPPNQEDQEEGEEEDGDDDEGEEEGDEEKENGEKLGVSRDGGCGSQSASPNCPICLEPWTSDGPHRVCCIPCGHVYGKLCLEKWIKRCRKSAGKCPQCNVKFKHKDIINLYAPLIVIQNDDLDKEVRLLRENNELLKLENSRLQEEIKKQKIHSMNNESSGRQKMLCLERRSAGGGQLRLFAYSDDRLGSSTQSLSEKRFPPQTFGIGEPYHSNFILQKEFRLDGARVMGIDAPRQILLVSGKPPGVSGEHVLNKISFLDSNEIDKIQLPSNTGVVRDLCILSDGLALLASLGKRLSLFSLASNNCVVKYELPGPAWSCSGDSNSPYLIYAGLQNGMLLMFDVRQTSTHLDCIEGLSRHPIHTIHSIVDNSSSKVLTASSAGPCVWSVGGRGERPFLIPEMDNYGVCLSLAYGSLSNDIVASFRPKVDLSSDITPSQTSVSPSPSISGTGKLGSHVLVKKTSDTSYQKVSAGCGYVSEVRMSKSAILPIEDGLLFAGGDELSRRICLWNLPSFQVHSYLRPHQHPILDLKYASAAGPGFLGCICEDRCQVYTCF